MPSASAASAHTFLLPHQRGGQAQAKLARAPAPALGRTRRARPNRDRALDTREIHGYLPQFGYRVFTDTALQASPAQRTSASAGPRDTLTR